MKSSGSFSFSMSPGRMSIFARAASPPTYACGYSPFIIGRRNQSLLKPWWRSAAALSSALSEAGYDALELNAEPMASALPAARIARNADACVRFAMCDARRRRRRVAHARRVHPAESSAMNDEDVRLVEDHPVLHAVAERFDARAGVRREVLDDLAVRPAALVLQRLRQVPVVQRRERVMPAASSSSTSRL